MNNKLQKKDNTHCCVPQCVSKGWKNPDLSFHRFPSERNTFLRRGPRGQYEVNQRKEWIWRLRIGKKVSHRMSVCSKHFKTDDYYLPTNLAERRRLKPSAVPSQFLPQTSSSTSAKTPLREQKKARRLPSFKKLQRKKKILQEPLEEITGMESPVIIKQETEYEDNSNINALEQTEEICRIVSVVGNQETELGNNVNINTLEQTEESLQEELQQVKLELLQMYTDMDTLKKEKDLLDQEFSSAQNAHSAIVSVKDSELSKKETELQQAYSEINALRTEREELVQKLITTDFKQSILQNLSTLHYYTGLNSLKDFHAILSLLSQVESGVNSLPFDAQVLIVLVKLKVNLPISDLGYRFQTSRSIVCSILDCLIPHLETKLELIVQGPINKALRKNIPHCYKNIMYENLYQRLRRFLKSKETENEELDL